MRDTRHRHHLSPVADPSSTWKLYALACEDDPPIRGTVARMRLDWPHHQVHLVSGADPVSESMTRAWLKHWHVGHARAILSVRGAATPRVRAASQGGYLLTISLTEPELRRLQEMAGGRSVQEFAVRAVLGLARTGASCCHLNPDNCMMNASRNTRREPRGKTPAP